tara:strand:- start:779 stop:913 length:135 start_codon:yes stop_codon:yes gene_type:complete
MIRKINILIFIAVLFFSCGKKGDPVYTGQNQNSEKIVTLVSRLI